jgi:hypothetical protein
LTSEIRAETPLFKGFWSLFAGNMGWYRREKN